MSRAPTGYSYVRHLGAGGFGDVDLARHEATGRLVAIKYIHRHLLGDADVLERFRREARVLAATDVTSVVRVYDLDTSGDPVHLVMEYVPGVTLWDLVESAAMPARQALPLLGDVAEALAAMAAQGVVHRDIKPSNVFVLPGGRAKLGDFGLARTMVADAGFRTVGAPAGTPAYFPPEVSSGQAEATVESDSYSFAVMVYEVLTGVRPIVAPDAVSLITAHWTQPPRPVTDALPGFPADAGAVLMRALAKSPAGRPAPLEVMEALLAVPPGAWPTDDLPDVPVPAAPYDGQPAARSGPVGPKTVAVAAPVTVLAPLPVSGSLAPVAVGSGRRRPSAVAVAVVATVAVTALTSAVVWRSQAPDDRPGGDRGPQTSGALAVTGVDLTGAPAVSRCPRGLVELVATVVTDGAPGEVVVAWTLPDGSSGPTQTFAVGDGQRRVVAELSATFTGDNPVEGRARVVVEPGSRRDELSVSYVCP